jgi:hypothetical protein
VILTLKEYAALMRLSPTKVRRQLKFGLCDVQPADFEPYRWRRADVEDYWASANLQDARKRHRKFIEAINQSEARTA